MTETPALSVLLDTTGMSQNEILNLPPEDPRRIIHLQRQQIENLKRECEQYKHAAQKDIRSQMIFSNNQQATEIKFRQMKIATRAMKKMGRQVGLAARYMAQKLDNQDMGMAADLRFISQIFTGDYWGHELVMDGTPNYNSIGEIKAADLIMNTQAYRRAVELADGENQEGNPHLWR